MTCCILFHFTIRVHHIYVYLSLTSSNVEKLLEGQFVSSKLMSSPAPRGVKLVCLHQLRGHPKGWKQLRVLWCKPKENPI